MLLPFTLYMNHLVLIGMPGSGKSTIARALSGALSLPYLDGDTAIEKRTGEPLHATVARLGLDAFLRLEEETILSLDLNHTVFAPGGSAVYSRAAMEHMKRGALTVYLRVPRDLLEKRAGPLSQRGVIIRDGQSFQDLCNEREPLYVQYADLILDTDDLPVDALIEKLLPRIHQAGIVRS